MYIYQYRPPTIIFIIILIFTINNVLRYFTSMNVYDIFKMLLIRIVNFDILQFKL